MAGIPSKLHFIFLNKEEPFPPLFKDCFERAKELHPGWEIKIYNEDDAQNVLGRHFPTLLPVYNSYIHTVQKSDVLRVALVYLFGGFYLDLDMACIKSLDELRDHALVLGKERLLSEDELNHHEAKHSFRIGNYMFGATPKHPFWLAFLKEAVKSAAKNVLYENDVIKTTGPELLTNVYHSNKRKYRNIIVLDNKDRRCLAYWHDAISCHFGNFACHLHLGTWRWKGEKSTLPAPKPLSKKEYQNVYADISRQLQEKLFTDNIVVLEAVIEEPYYLSNLKTLYEKCKAICKTVTDTKNIHDKNILLFGDPRKYKHKISQVNNNILYTCAQEITNDWINCLNQNYHSCIVPHQHIKESLLAAGVHIQIAVIALGFQRALRNFAGDDDEQENHFTVAFTATDHMNELEKVIAACEAAKRNGIPNLRLKLITDSVQKKKSLLKDKQIGERSWIETDEIKKIFTGRFGGIHGFIFINSESQWSLGPRDVLHQGIPSIIIDHPIYNELVNSGYYPVIPSSEHALEQGLQELFHNYPHYNAKAIHGSRWIEDKWLPESTAIEVIGFVNRPLPFHSTSLTQQLL